MMLKFNLMNPILNYGLIKKYEIEQKYLNNTKIITFLYSFSVKTIKFF